MFKSDWHSALSLPLSLWFIGSVSQCVYVYVCVCEDMDWLYFVIIDGWTTEVTPREGWSIFFLMAGKGYSRHIIFNLSQMLSWRIFKENDEWRYTVRPRPRPSDCFYPIVNTGEYNEVKSLKWQNEAINKARHGKRSDPPDSIVSTTTTMHLSLTSDCLMFLSSQV